MDMLSGLVEQVPQVAQHQDATSILNIVVSLLTLATVIFTAGALWQQVQGLKDDVKALKQDVKAQGMEQAEMRGRFNLPSKPTPTPAE
jgi:predicted RNA-binding protein with PIN domain